MFLVFNERPNMNKLISNTWIWLVEYEEQDKKISKVQLVHI